MTLKNGNIVAVERRMDLASLFCMIGRHGPAVAVAVLALVSVLVGFIIYRTVKGKRRKATAAAGDSDGETPVEERDASEELQSPVMSTDLSDEGSLDVKEDTDLIHNGHNVRRRCAAAADAAAPAWKEPSPFFPPMEDIQEIKIKHASSDDTVESAIMEEAYSAVETYREEACQCLTSDSYAEAEMVLEDAVDCTLSTTNVIFEGAVEEVHDMKSYLAEPATIIDEGENEEDKALTEECQEGSEVTTAGDASAWKNKQEEDTNHMSEDGDIETNTVGSSLEDPIICIEDAPVPCICSVKEEELEKEIIESVLHSNISNSHLSMEEEQKAGCEEAEEECEDYKLSPETATIYSLTDEKEINLPSVKQYQSNNAMDEEIHVIQDHVRIQGEEASRTEADADLPQFNNNEEEIVIKEENGFTSHQEDMISHDVDSQVNEKKLENADIVGNAEEPETLIVETSPTLPCLSASPTAETKNDSFSHVTTDAKAHISGMTDFVDLSDFKETPVDYTIAPPVNEITDSTILGSKISLHYTDNEPEKVPSVVFEVEYTDPVCAPDVQDCFKDKQSDQMVQSEITDKAAELYIDACDSENTTPPVTAEGVSPPQGSPCSTQLIDEIIDSESYDQAIDTAVADTKIISSETAETEFLHKPSISQDQQRDQMENENLDVGEFTSSSDADLCNIICSSACIIADKEQQSDQIEQTKSTDETGAISTSVSHVSNDSPLAADLMAEEKSSPDVPSQGQQCDHKITETFDELEVPDSMAGELFVPNVLSSAQDKQSDLKTDSETFQEEKVAAAADALTCSYGSPTALSMAEETSVPDVLYSPKDNKSDHKQDSETSDQAELAAASDTLAQTNLTEPLMPVEEAHPDMIPPSGDQFDDSMENSEHLDDKKATSVSETLAYDEARNLSTVISEELSNTEMMLSCQDILSSQVRNNEAFPEVTVEFSPPMCPIYFPSLEQSELGDTDLFSGVDRESGISSMAVSPDLQDAHIVFDMNAGNNVVPVQSYSLFTDDVAQAYSNENTGSMVFGPYPSHTPLLSHSERRKKEWINNETCAANEDLFGHEVENSYQREMDRFMAQIVDSVTSLADGLKKEADVKVVEVVEVLGIKEKKAEGSVEKKDGAKAEEDEAAIFEKTEINIMEATMDNNEWITDSNYPVLPWMNLSTPSVTQDHTKPNQMLTEENSVKAEVSQMHTTDELPVTEVHQTSAPSINDEISENSKKILAVQPMPQNVNVIFRVHYYTQSPYQTVAVTGDQQELGNWKEFIPLQRAKDGHWSTVVSLPAESHVEWKFVLLDKGEVCRWEECGNRLLETGSGDDLVVQKWWGIF